MEQLPLDYRVPPGARLLDLFRDRLKRLFGDEHRAWKMAYDKQNLGRVCFTEFGRISRELGITGSLATLWRELDADGGGFITLDELAPDQAIELNVFKGTLVRKGRGNLL